MDPEREVPPEPPKGTPVRVRRAPRYRVFLITGAVVGLVVGILIGLLGGTSAEYSRVTVVGYLAVALTAIGAAIGGLIAVSTERRRKQP